MASSAAPTTNEKYGPLSAEYYQLTKPIGGDYPDVPYYLRRLAGTKGRVLEMGAGTGRLIIPLLEAGLRMEALEPSPPMREWLAKNLRSRKLECPVHAASAEDFVAPESFAAIVASFGSFQLLNPRAVALQTLRNFHRNLAPGGALYVDLDRLHPEPEFAAKWVQGPAIPAGPKTKIVIGGTRDWDLPEQLEKIALRYERHEAGKLTATEVQNFSLRGYGRAEFETLLREVGFAKVDFCVDYDPTDHDEASANALSFCYVAYK